MIQIEYDENCEPLIFEHAKDLLLHLKREQELVSSLVQFRASARRVVDQTEKIIRKVESANSNDHKEIGEALRNELAQFFAQLYSAIPRHDSMAREFARRLRDVGGKKTEAGAILYLSDREGNDVRQAMDHEPYGILLATLCQDERLPIIAGEVWQELLANSQNKLANVINEHSGEVTALQKYAKDTEDRIAKLQKKYEEVEKFQAPSDYWHKNGKWSRGIAVVIIVVVILAGWKIGTEIIDRADKIPEKLAEIEKSNSLPNGQAEARSRTYADYVPTILPITIIAFGTIWLIRVLLKIAFNLWHIGTDAAERAMLLKTWLAMMDSDDPPKDTEREIMMRQVFRHVPTGISDQDTVPQTPMTVWQGDLDGQPRKRN